MEVISFYQAKTQFVLVLEFSAPRHISLKRHTLLPLKIRSSTARSELLADDLTKGAIISLVSFIRIAADANAGTRA